MSTFYNKLPALLFAAALTSIATIGTAWANSGDQEARQEWLGNAEAKLDANMTYPQAALRKRESGTTNVQVKIRRTGEIISYKVTKKTGSRVLDREVKDMLERIGSFQAPKFSRDRTITLSVNLNYLMAHNTRDYAALVKQSERRGRVTVRSASAKSKRPTFASVRIISSNDS